MNKIDLQSKEWLKMVAIVYIIAHILAWLTFGDIIFEDLKPKK